MYLVFYNISPRLRQTVSHKSSAFKNLEQNVIILLHVLVYLSKGINKNMHVLSYWYLKLRNVCVGQILK